MVERIIKSKGKAYLLLPSEFVQEEEIELFQLKEGYYLLSVPLHKKEVVKTKIEEKKELGEEEKRVLQKMLGIRFEGRTPPSIEKQLGEAEKIVLKNLLEKNIVNIFKSKKYPDGVYNIKDSVYGKLKGETKPAQINTNADYFVIADQKEAYIF